MFIDSHAHFDTCILDAGYTEDQLFEAMNENGVSTAVHVATEVSSFKWSISFAQRRPVYIALGIHPTSQYYENDISDMNEFIAHIEDSTVKDKFIAIGEVGLDYYHQKETRDEQIKIFEKQLSMACEWNKPVIIHTRDAFDDTYAVLKSSSIKKGLIHCFSGNPEQAEKFLELGFYISFAGNVTFKKAVNLQDSLKIMPINRLLFETDCPYLSPEPVRGSRNMPANVKYTYQYASGLKNIELPVLAEAVSNNFKALFLS